MKKINYAVVGLGVGLSHCDAAYKSQNANLYAVCDLKQEKLKLAQKNYPGVKVYESYDEMLKDSAIDIISVAVPSGMHAEFAVKAIEAGKNVLIEKPIDITPDKAMLIEQARVKANLNGLNLKVGIIHQNRFNAVMKPVKDALDSGKFGKIILGTFGVKWYRSQEYYNENGGWRGTWNMDGGGSLINQAVHTVDLMQWLMGDVLSVYSHIGIYNHAIETEDLSVSVIKFKSGAVATFTSSTCCFPGISTDIQVYGSLGSVEIDGDRLKSWKIMGGDNFEENEMFENYSNGNAAACAADKDLIVGHSVQVEDIINCVLNNKEPLVTPLEAIKSVKIINAIYKSAKENKEILL